MKLHTSNYIKKDYKISFDKKLAEKYLPIIYENKGHSGKPKSTYYRIVVKYKPTEFCIQYFYYWEKQDCIPPHNHDYEPIFIYLKPLDSYPTKIVNGGFHWTKFHKNEIRPRDGKRSEKLEKRRVNITESPLYPFGKHEKKSKETFYKIYPLKNKKDLTFRKYRPRFGIKICSNVFSGAKSDLQGRILKSSLVKMTDTVLNKWYFKNYKSYQDMPFGHDVASPFTFPYINYRDARPHLKKPKDLF